MTSQPRSVLYKISIAILPISLLLYLLSLTMKVATVETKIGILGIGQTTTESVKLLSTIKKLFETGDLTLGIILTAFTIIFPIGKYLALGYVMFSRTESIRTRVNGLIKNFGQWSMGDVFVVALLVVILRINSSVAQMRVIVEPGLYIFAASVLTGMIVSVLIAIDRDRPRHRTETSGRADAA